MTRGLHSLKFLYASIFPNRARAGLDRRCVSPTEHRFAWYCVSLVFPIEEKASFVASFFNLVGSAYLLRPVRISPRSSQLDDDSISTYYTRIHRVIFECKAQREQGCEYLGSVIGAITITTDQRIRESQRSTMYVLYAHWHLFLID